MDKVTRKKLIKLYEKMSKEIDNSPWLPVAPKIGFWGVSKMEIKQRMLGDLIKYGQIK